MGRADENILFDMVTTIIGPYMNVKSICRL